jgi:hypothetical protein
MEALMMSQKTTKFLLITMLSCFLLLLSTSAGFSYKYTGPSICAFEREVIEINQVETNITNFGEFGKTSANSSGCWWPKGSANAYIFGAGIWVAGIAGSDSVVINGYNTVGSGEECIPGPPQYNEEHITNPACHPEYRLFVSTVAGDWAEWPYVDSLGEKIVLGDQDTYCFFNSHRDSSQSEEPFISIDLTITRHTFAWTQALLENMLFFEYFIENTGTEDLTGMYVGIGTDLDIGNADDDLVGLDRGRSLGYTYTTTQEAGWDAIPPYYIGFSFLQGPIADDTVLVGQDPANPDTVIMPGERIPLTAFKKFTRDVDANDDHERYLVMAGYDFTITPPVYNPFGDSMDTEPSDKRMAMSAGPFNLAPGEADTIVMAMMFSNGNTGGLPYLLRQGDAAKQLYDLDWASPGPPSPPPTISALIPGDRQVTVCWDNSVEKTPDKYYPAMQAAGDTLYKEFDVEGYFVYRKIGKVGDWEQIAQFDKANGVTLLPDGTENAADAGLQYSFVDTNNVYNGFDYYYAVSAYDYNTSGQLGDTAFICLESGKADMVVVPRSDFGNEITNASANIDVSATTGAANTITPAASAMAGIMVTGDTYYANWQTIKENGGLPVYNYNIVMAPDSQLLSDIDAYVAPVATFSAFAETTIADTTGNTITTTIITDSTFVKHWIGNFVSPLFDGIEFSGSIDVYYVDSTHTFVDSTVVENDTLKVDTSYNYVNSVDIVLSPDSVKVTDDQGVPYTDNLAIAGVMERWALRGAVTFEITWKTIDANTITATINDVTNNATVPFCATWGDNWSFGPVNLAYPEVNSQFLTSDNLSSRTYFYICGTKIYFNFLGSEAYPMNWDNRPVDGEVWRFYCSGDVVPSSGNTFTITSTGFSFGARKLDNVKVVPNPYIVRNPWEVSSDYGELRFTNLPDECEIRIYTLAGNLIKTLEHTVEATAASAIQGGTEKWDILTDNNQRPASGIYIYHIETPDGDTKTGKFALIR